MTKTDEVVHAIRTFRNLDDLVPLLAWHVDKTRRARYTGTEWLKSLVRWRLVIRRGPTFWSCRIPGFQPDDHPRARQLLVRAVPGTRPLSFPIFDPTTIGPWN